METRHQVISFEWASAGDFGNLEQLQHSLTALQARFTRCFIVYQSVSQQVTLCSMYGTVLYCTLIE